MKRHLSFCLSILYLLPWGIQCLVTNFMPIYVSSLDFATEQTVGEVVGLGAAVTAVSQLLWAYFAGRMRRKSLVLALSLALITAFSLLFGQEIHTKTHLILLVILFYSAYMAHQPLIDTIASEQYGKTGHSFAFFRSFASLGYAIVGLLFTFLPHQNSSAFFLYTAILAAISLLFSFGIRDEEAPPPRKKQEKRGINGAFLCFLVYTLILFICSSAISAFFSVYYTAEEHLGGSVGVFSLLVGVSAVAEWLFVMLFSKITVRMKPSYIFVLIAIFGIFRALIIAVSNGPVVASLSFIFTALWFGLLWASVTPHIKRIVPKEGNAFAQGVWTVVASGVGSFTGSYLGGLFAEAFGIRALFWAVTLLLTLLALATPFLVRNTKSPTEDEKKTPPSPPYPSSLKFM